MIVSVQFGPFAPPLKEQLAGYGISREQMNHFQLDADALTRLAVRGYFGERPIASTRRNLLRRIVKACKVKP